MRLELTRSCLRIVLTLLAGWPAIAVADNDSVAFFTEKIEPLLVAHCYECHGEDAEGGLRLDSSDTLARGGNSGPMVIAGHPQRSLLMRALSYDDELQMPPHGKLDASEIALFEQWIRQGAIDPRAKRNNQVPVAGAEPNHLNDDQDDGRRYSEFVRRHFDFMTERSIDRHGAAYTAMWLATFDTSTGGLPAQPMPRELRWYRSITSPQGSNLYWDQPAIVAAYELSRLTGDERYSVRADEYIRDFLSRCASEESGLFLWGNHIYYDVVSDRIRSFSGGYHECRPHTPAWETFWRQNPEATERAIRAMGQAHIKDRQTGRFCRHANPAVAAGTFQAGEVENAKPFLEAGALIIDSLCWLADKTDDPNGELTDLALRVARYSFAQRDETTGLLRNQPVDKRWDYYASTTEVGLWAGSLLRATEYTGKPEFQQIADAAMRSWLRFGFDETVGKYYGRLAVASGLPQTPEDSRGWKPPMYAEVFDIHERPTHNYPMPMAEACLSLYEKTRAPIFLQAVNRWVKQIAAALPANGQQGAYAEDYGRVIHFLTRVSLSLDRRDCKDLAHRIANEAIARLYVDEQGVFRSHPNDDRCDAVDGPGILFLSLLYLDSEHATQTALAF